MCPASGPEQSQPVAACLKGVYEFRIKELRGAVRQAGGLTFVWRSLYLTAPDTMKKGERTYEEVTPGFGTLTASWPQALSTAPEWVAWNHALEAAVRTNAQTEGDGGSSHPATWAASPGSSS